MTDADNIEISRSDLGCGGWSLGAEMPTGWVHLLDGPAEWDDQAGDWSRPNAADWAEAQRRLGERKARGIVRLPLTDAQAQNDAD